jgi:hypothetical protein
MIERSPAEVRFAFFLRDVMGLEYGRTVARARSRRWDPGGDQFRRTVLRELTRWSLVGAILGYFPAERVQSWAFETSHAAEPLTGTELELERRMGTTDLNLHEALRASQTRPWSDLTSDDLEIWRERSIAGASWFASVDTRIRARQTRPLAQRFLAYVLFAADRTWLRHMRRRNRAIREAESITALLTVVEDDWLFDGMTEWLRQRREWSLPTGPVDMPRLPINQFVHGSLYGRLYDPASVIEGWRYEGPSNLRERRLAEAWALVVRAQARVQELSGSDAPASGEMSSDGR